MWNNIFVLIEFIVTLTLLTFIGHIFFKLRNDIFVALINSSASASYLSLFSCFLTQWLSHIFGVLHIKHILIIMIITILTANDMHLRSNTFIAFQTPYTFHIVVHMALVVIDFLFVNQLWVKGMLIEGKGPELLVFGGFAVN